jgi:hypothetical protein
VVIPGFASWNVHSCRAYLIEMRFRAALMSSSMQVPAGMLRRRWGDMEPAALHTSPVLVIGPA